MKDMLASLEKLRTDAAEAAPIRDLATESHKRELFTRLADHYATLAAEVERAMATRLAKRTKAAPLAATFILNVGCWQILLQKSKIEQPQKSRESRSLDFSAAASSFSATTEVR